MKRLFFLCALVFLIQAAVNTNFLFSQEPDSTHYPKTVCHRWNFVTVDPERGEIGQKEIDDQYPYERPAWNAMKTEFLRRFDFLMAEVVHVMSFDDDVEPPDDDYFTDGLSLNHDHFGHRYDHDAYPGGSQQDLFAKSKWMELTASILSTTATMTIRCCAMTRPREVLTSAIRRSS